MKEFSLRVYDCRKQLAIDDVTSFIGEDASGSFGILAGHSRLLTVLVFGLARFRRGNMPWEYLAMPGAVLYFADNTLSLVCRHYLVDTQYERISGRLLAELVAEEEQLQDIRQSLKSMEEALLKRMWEMKRQGVSGL